MKIRVNCTIRLAPLRLLVALISILAPLGPAIGQTAFPKAFDRNRDQALMLDRWSLAEGLPQTSVVALAQDADGYLWIGTEEGLVRFDGLRFTVFDRRNTPALRSHIIQALAADGDGLWIGTRAGAYRYENGHFESLDGLAADSNIRVLLVETPTRVWAAADDGLYLYDGSRFALAPQGAALPTLPARSLLIDRQGKFWIGTQDGLCRFAGTRSEKPEHCFTADDGWVDPRTLALLEDSKERIWVGTFDGLYQVIGDTLVPYERQSELYQSSVRALAEDRRGDLWIGTTGALHRSSAERLEVLRWPGGEPVQSIFALLSDDQGSIWAGSRVDGLVHTRERLIRNLGPDQGLPDKIAWTVLEDRSGALWTATAGGLARLAPNGDLTRWTSADGLPEDSVLSLFEDSAGSLWIGTQSQGLGRFVDGRFLFDGPQPNNPQQRVTVLVEHPVGTLWAGTFDGLWRRDPQGWTRFSNLEGLPSKAIFDLEVDPRGRLWVATSKGLAAWRGDRFESIPEIDEFLLALLADEDDLWIGTWGSGLLRWREGERRDLALDENLYDVLAMTKGDDGGLWMTSNKGLFRVDHAALREIADSGRNRVPVRVFDDSEGMIDRECNGGNQPAIWKGGDGRLWIPTTHGVATFVPQAELEQLPTPRPRLEEFALNEEPQPLGGIATVPPGGRHALTFRFTAPSFSNPADVLFRYRLDGFDRTWIDAGTRRLAQYTNLPHGDFAFRIAARLPGGGWSAPAKPFFVRVEPAFHQTWVFRILVIALTAGLLGALLRARVRFLVRRDRVALLQAQKGELEDILRTISHDLKSPLFTIQGFAGFLAKHLETGDRDSADTALEKIRQAARTMGRTLDELQELARVGREVRDPQAIALEPLIREALAMLAGPLQERGVAARVEADLPTVVGDRQRVLQIFQNLIENASKYMGDEAEPRIEIGARSSPGHVLCHVRDNGLGIEPERFKTIFDAFETTGASQTSSGLGLALVQKAVEAHGGRIWVESQGKGCGAAFYFTLPTGS